MVLEVGVGHRGLVGSRDAAGGDGGGGIRYDPDPSRDGAVHSPRCWVTWTTSHSWGSNSINPAKRRAAAWNSGALHAGEVLGRLPLQVVDYLGAVHAAVHARGDESGERRGDVVDDVDVDLDDLVLIYGLAAEDVDEGRVPGVAADLGRRSGRRVIARPCPAGHVS